METLPEISLPHDLCDDCLGLSDEQLAKQVAFGNIQAYNELAFRHRASCLAVAVSMMRNHADAEDAVQNALWKAYRRIGQFEHRSRFKHWLLRIVTNECLMRLRGNKRRNSQSLQGLPAEAVATDASPERQFLLAERRQKVTEAVQRLPLLLRQPVYLHEIAELTLPDVACRLGTSVAATKSRLHRGRRELKTRVSSVAA